MLTDILVSKIDNFSNLDLGWYQMILDHKQMICRESPVIIISDEDKVRFKFKLEHFLRENHINQAIHWIVRLVNDLDTYHDFTLLNALYTPQLQTISNLYRQYRTSITVS